MVTGHIDWSIHKGGIALVVREDRKEQIMDRAVGVFAEKGYYKATTALVAKAAGVTQPYVFHFFKNKEELFNCATDRAVERIYEAFSQVEAPADQLMESMGRAFMSVMKSHRDEMVMVMQAYTIVEPEIREHVREKMQFLHQFIIDKFKAVGSPNPEEGASQFIGMGFLVTAAEVLQLPQLLCFDFDSD